MLQLHTEGSIGFIDQGLSTSPLTAHPPHPRQRAPHLADACVSLPLTSLSVLNRIRHGTVLRSDVTHCSGD